MLPQHRHLRRCGRSALLLPTLPSALPGFRASKSEDGGKRHGEKTGAIMQSEERFCQLTTLGFPPQNKTDRKMLQQPGEGTHGQTRRPTAGRHSSEHPAGRGGEGEEGESSADSSTAGSADPDPARTAPHLPPAPQPGPAALLIGGRGGRGAAPSAARSRTARPRPSPCPEDGSQLRHGGAQPAAPHRQAPPRPVCPAPSPAAGTGERQPRGGLLLLLLLLPPPGPAPHSRQHGDGRPHHAVREAAALHVQPGPAAAIELLHLGLRFRHHPDPPPAGPSG